MYKDEEMMIENQKMHETVGIGDIGNSGRANDYREL